MCQGSAPQQPVPGSPLGLGSAGPRRCSTINVELLHNVVILRSQRGNKHITARPGSHFLGEERQKKNGIVGNSCTPQNSLPFPQPPVRFRPKPTEKKEQRKMPEKKRTKRNARKKIKKKINQEKKNQEKK
jgi:hypothetical protein